MIAGAGYRRLKAGESDDMHMAADITMRLQNLENIDDELRKKKVRYKL